MTRNTRMRQPAHSWRYVLPATGTPIGGGLMKMGHASTLAGAGVALAPLVILIIVYIFFAVGYIPAVICFLRSGRDQQDAKTRQDAITHLIATSTNAMVALLTFTPMDGGAHVLQADRP